MRWPASKRHVIVVIFGRKARKRAGMSRTDDIFFFSGVQSSRFFFGNGA